MATHLVGLAEDGTWFRHADGDTYFGARTAKMEPEPPAALAHHEAEAMLAYVLPVLLAVSLMHCRNVEIRTVEPDPEASRAHRRRHHHRLVRYQCWTSSRCAGSSTRPGQRALRSAACAGR